MLTEQLSQKYSAAKPFFIENYRKNRHVHQILPAFNFRSRGAKIKWAKIKCSENLNEAKFEKSKVFRKEDILNF